MLARGIGWMQRLRGKRPPKISNVVHESGITPCVDPHENLQVSGENLT